MSLLENENLIEQNLGLIYRHISFRASKILKDRKFSALRQTLSLSHAFEGSFGLDSSDRYNLKNVADSKKKRSNSFKLGPRPRECKDQVRKAYRRNSIHVHSAKFQRPVVSQLQNLEEAEENIMIEREQEVINFHEVELVPLEKAASPSEFHQ